jgi:hypothetical protein
MDLVEQQHAWQKEQSQPQAPKPQSLFLDFLVQRPADFKAQLEYGWNFNGDRTVLPLLPS